MIIFRYLTRQLLVTWLAIGGVLLVISLSGRFATYLNQAAAGNMKVSFLFAIMFYRIPGFLEIISPLAFFISILLVYGRLHSESEMVILQGCGVGPHKLLLYTGGAAFTVVVLNALLALWLAPAGLRQTGHLINVQNSLTALDMVQAGKFQKSGNSTYFVRKLSSDRKHMSDVFVSRTNPADSPQKISIFSAAGGRIEVDKRNRYMVLEDGYRYDITPGHPGGRITHYNDYGVLVRSNPVPPVTAEEALPTRVLRGDHSSKAAGEWQWRLSQILIVPVSVLMALPLSGVSPRQGRYFKLLPGVLLYLIYLALLMSLQDPLKRGVSDTFPGLYGVHALFLLVALGLFYRPAIAQWFRRDRLR